MTQGSSMFHACCPAAGLSDAWSNTSPSCRTWVQPGFLFLAPEGISRVGFTSSEKKLRNPETPSCVQDVPGLGMLSMGLDSQRRQLVPPQVAFVSPAIGDGEGCCPCQSHTAHSQHSLDTTGCRIQLICYVILFVMLCYCQLFSSFGRQMLNTHQIPGARPCTREVLGAR